MHLTRKTWLWLGIWLLVALVLLLVPSPREWGPAGVRIRLVYEEIHDWLQPLVHFILMTVLAATLLPLFRRRRAPEAFVHTVIIAVCIAMVFEIVQGFLPVSFARQCDPNDLIPSLAGAVCGALYGLRLRRRTVQKKETSASS